jgi:Na+/melibiose symporter-like transporter
MTDKLSKRCLYCGSSIILLASIFTWRRSNGLVMNIWAFFSIVSFMALFIDPAVISDILDVIRTNENHQNSGYLVISPRAGGCFTRKGRGYA